MKHLNISRLFFNNTFCKVISIIGAVFIWAVVTLSIKTESERLIRNVPIDFSIEGTAVEALGLSTFDHSDNSVNISVEGKRSVINTLSKDDFSVALSIGRVSSPGKHTVNIDVTLKDNIGKIEIVDFSPKTITVNFDYLASKQIPINTNISNFSAKSGLMLDKAYPSIPEVTITGPQTVINTVSSCYADIDNKKKELSETLVLTSIPLKLYDENDKEIIDKNIVLDKETVDVSIPVLKIKALPLVVHFLNTPPTFEEKDFEYSISTSKIKVAGPSDSIEKMSQLDVKYLDLKSVKPGDTVTMNIDLPSGFVNIDNISSIDITIPKDKYTEKRFIVSQFKAINSPKGKDIKFITNKIYNVSIIGKRNILNKLNSSDIVAEVDLSDIELSVGTTKVPVKINIPTKEGAFWAYGDYSAIIKSN